MFCITLQLSIYRHWSLDPWPSSHGFVLPRCCARYRGASRPFLRRIATRGSTATSPTWTCSAWTGARGPWRRRFQCRGWPERFITGVPGRLWRNLEPLSFFVCFFFQLKQTHANKKWGKSCGIFFFALGGSHANLESKEEERSSIISRFLQIFDSSDLVAEGFLGISLGYPKVCPRGCPCRHQTTKAAAPANSSTTLHARLSAYAAGVWLSVSWQVEGVFQAAQESR